LPAPAGPAPDSLGGGCAGLDQADQQAADFRERVAEVASFGLSRAQAEDRGHRVSEAKIPFRAIGKALVEGEPGGFCKVVSNAETDLVLGMHAIGPHVTELIAEGCYAKLVEGATAELGMSVHAHPTLAEILGAAARAVTGQAINF
jgi:dihydrolipoamide dehydrogenase